MVDVEEDTFLLDRLIPIPQLLHSVPDTHTLLRDSAVSGAPIGSVIGLVPRALTIVNCGVDERHGGVRINKPGGVGLDVRLLVLVSGSGKDVFTGQDINNLDLTVRVEALLDEVMTLKRHNMNVTGTDGTNPDNLYRNVVVLHLPVLANNAVSLVVVE